MNTSTPPTVRSDPELLALARVVLLGEGYSVEDAPSDGFPMLLAENRYFIIGVVTAPTIAQLILAEGLAEEALARRLAEADVGPKLWDAYLILLTQERSPEGGDVTRELFEINYDTRGVRRIAHSGVGLSLSEVRNALTPFVTPIELDDPLIGADAFPLFIEALVERGVARETAERTVAAFQQGARVDDAV